jgi:hypothetical protein
MMKSSKVPMTAEIVFNLMAAVVEDPGFKYLTSYKVDFYKYDKAYLERTWVPGIRYMWIVRESGTHLVRLGVHQKMNDELIAALGISDNMAIYIVSDDGVKQISVNGANALLNIFDYSIHGTVVCRGTEPLAAMDIDARRDLDNNRLTGQVKYSSQATPRCLNLADLTALAQIAECEVIAYTQSLFTPTSSITINGEDLRELIISKQEDQVSKQKRAA